MSAVADPMAPSASPGALGKTHTGVRRVNNVPLLLVVCALAAFLVVMALVAMDRAKQQQVAAADSQRTVRGNTQRFAQEIVGAADRGIIAPAAALAAPQPSVAAAPPTLVRAEVRVAPTQAPRRNRAPAARDPEAEQLRQLRLAMLADAAKAKTGVSLPVPTTAAARAVQAPGTEAGGAARSQDPILSRIAEVRRQIDAETRDDPTASFQARLAQQRGRPTEMPSSLTARRSGGYAQFDSSGQGDRWSLDSTSQSPRSPYQLRAGSVIGATLISGVNSDLPGQIVGQVSQDIFDTATGNHLLVPQGSRLVGSYSSEVAFGQSRVLIAWQRIVFPDGRALDLGAMPGGDAAGYAGFKDRVNNNYLRTFASALLVSGVVGGVALSQNNNDGNAPDTRSVLSESLGQQLGQVTAQIVARNLNVSPTIEVRPGYRFNVIVTKDITLPAAYRAFEYQNPAQPTEDDLDFRDPVERTTTPPAQEETANG
jgi:type IV secretion system protein TrbI